MVAFLDKSIIKMRNVVNNQSNSFASKFNFRTIRPNKCCFNCAFSSIIDNACSCLFVYAMNMEMHLTGFGIFETCGICDRWTPLDLALAAKYSSSLEEFKLKKAAIAEDIPTPELEERFFERKATDKMYHFMNRIYDDSRWHFTVTPRPFAIMSDDISDDGKIENIIRSNAFHSVCHWISENKPKWENWIDTRQLDKNSNLRFFDLI